MATHPGAIHQSRTAALTFDVSRMPRRPGAMLPFNDVVPSPSRIGLDLVAIAKDALLTLDLRFESVSEGVLVSGTMSAPTTGECARCLGATEGEVDVDVTELFAYPQSTTEATTDPDEVGHIVDDMIDLEQTIVDAVGLELPLTPLCRDDCPGLCTECGIALAEAEPGHHHDLIDPRWAKLASMGSDGAADDGTGS